VNNCIWLFCVFTFFIVPFQSQHKDGNKYADTNQHYPIDDYGNHPNFKLVSRFCCV